MVQVSVVIPTYNRAWCLQRSINSVLWQSFRDFELIVVDDGSTDGTTELLSKYKDTRLRIVRHEMNMGFAAALNTGISHAQSDVIAFQDSDDEWLPEKLETVIREMHRQPDDVGVVYHDRWRIDPDGQMSFWGAVNRVNPEDGIIWPQSLDERGHLAGTPCLLVRRACFEKVGGFDETLKRFVDWEMNIRISRHYRFKHVPEPLTICHMHGTGITGSGEAAGISAVEHIVEKYFDELIKHRELMAKRTYWIGSSYMRRGNGKRGRKFLWTCITYSRRRRYVGAFALSLFGSTAYRSVHWLFKRKKAIDRAHTDFLNLSPGSARPDALLKAE